jgi:hypothetical protein
MSCITDGVTAEPEIKTPAPESLAYLHTFEVKLTVLEGSNDPNLEAPSNVYASFQNLEKPPEVRRIKVSPNRIPSICPTEGCDLVWRHRVGIDDPKLTPKHCAYCANAARLAQSQFQRESGAIHEAFLGLGEPPPEEDEKKTEEYNEKLAGLSLLTKDFNARVDEHAFCYRVFDEKVRALNDPIRIEFNKVLLEEGKPYTV